MFQGHKRWIQTVIFIYRIHIFFYLGIVHSFDSFNEHNQNSMSSFRIQGLQTIYPHFFFRNLFSLDVQYIQSKLLLLLLICYMVLLFFLGTSRGFQWRKLVNVK